MRAHVCLCVCACLCYQDIELSSFTISSLQFFILLSKNLFLFLCRSVLPAWTCVYQMHAIWGQERLLNSLKLQWHMAVRRDLCGGGQAQVLCRNSKCFSLLGHRCSPFHLVFESLFLWSSLAWLKWLSRKLQMSSCLRVLSTGHTAASPCLRCFLFCFRWVLGIWAYILILCRKYFTNWALSSALSIPLGGGVGFCSL